MSVVKPTAKSLDDSTPSMDATSVRSMRRFTTEGCAYLWILLVLYAAYYGAILQFSGGLPYVMDANESFSVYWHSYNLLHFDITESYGLTDEASSVSAAAHPYLHTHQGNMPRLFGALLYALGARSIEAQIVTTTAVIGTASVVFAFFAMRRLSSPLFALIFTALLLTDYLQFAQWNVVTYRVWYGFLFFGIVLGIMRAGEARAGWAIVGLYGSFVLLFYNELVFAGLMGIIGGLFTGYWHSKRLPIAMRLWAVEIAGAATALGILSAQLLSKFGLEVVKQDFVTTFLARNLRDNVEWQEAAIDFFKQHNIVYWLNLSDSSSVRNLSAFVSSQTTYVLQLYTPWLVLLAIVILGGFGLSVVMGSRVGARLTERMIGSRLLSLALARKLCAWHCAVRPEVQLTLCLSMVLGMAVLLGIRVAVGSEVFGIRAEADSFKLPLNRLAIVSGTAVSLAWSLQRWWSGGRAEPARLPVPRVGALMGFLAVVTVFISYHSRLYDQSFSSLWRLPFGFPGGTLMGRALVLAGVLLGALFIVFGWRPFLRRTEAKALVGPLALLVIGEMALLAIFFLSPGYVISGYLGRTAPFAVFFASLPVAATFYLVTITGGRAGGALRRLVKRSGLSAHRSIASCLAVPRMTARMVAFGLLVALTLYWVALQGGYARMLPPNHFAVLKKLRKAPFAGKSAVVMTYAAPVATMTGRWAYFDGIYFMNRLHRTDRGYVVERDMRNYLWLADRDTNIEYRRPDYFICLWPQSLRNAVADQGKGYSDFNNYCARLPIVAAAAESKGLMRHQLVAADTSARGSWAIVKLDHELPPMAQGVTATLLPGKARMSAKASYRYLQQDGTPEGATRVDLVGDPDARACALGDTAEVLASGRAGDELVVPRDFSGTIALRVTPVSIRKAGEGTLSNRFVVNAGAPSVTPCPLGSSP